MQTKQIALLAVFSILSFTACKNQKTSSGNAKNSKGEIASSQIELPTAAEAAELDPYRLEYLHHNTQRFVIPSRQSMTITGSNGLELNVEPSALECEDGSNIDGAITVSLIEITNTGELFRSNAATISDGRLLASGGSYFVEMRCGGKNLRIKKGHSLTMKFPRIAPGEMELFYGERNTDGDMNWKRADNELVKAEVQPEENISFEDNYSGEDFNALQYKLNINANTWYNSLSAIVYYYDKPVKVVDYVKLLTDKHVDVCLDSVNLWPADLPSKGVDTNYLVSRYGPNKKYRIMTGADWREQQERIKVIQDRVARRSQNSLRTQLAAYYAPAQIGSLGWINCDRFYDEKEQTEMEIEPAITLRSSTIQYFVIFKRFNGLLSGKLAAFEGDKLSINQLPINEPVTVVAFTKSNGVLYHCREESVIRKNSKLALNLRQLAKKKFRKCSRVM